MSKYEHVRPLRLTDGRLRVLHLEDGTLLEGAGRLVAITPYVRSLITSGDAEVFDPKAQAQADAVKDQPTKSLRRARPAEEQSE